jgi:hypothetical protein
LRCSENPDTLLDAIRALRRDPRRRQQMGAQGRTYARSHWRREQLLPEMERQLARVAANGAWPQWPSTGSEDTLEPEALVTHAR